MEFPEVAFTEEEQKLFASFLNENGTRNKVQLAHAIRDGTLLPTANSANFFKFARLIFKDHLRTRGHSALLLDVLILTETDLLLIQTASPLFSFTEITMRFFAREIEKLRSEPPPDFRKKSRTYLFYILFFKLMEMWHLEKWQGTRDDFSRTRRLYWEKKS